MVPGGPAARELDNVGPYKASSDGLRVDLVLAQACVRLSLEQKRPRRSLAVLQLGDGPFLNAAHPVSIPTRLCPERTIGLSDRHFTPEAAGNVSWAE